MQILTSVKLNICLGTLLTILLYEYITQYGITPKFCFGMFFFGILLSAYRYNIIKEVLCGEHEELVNFINERLDDEESETEDSNRID